jgi:hypothetical protein
MHMFNFDPPRGSINSVRRSIISPQNTLDNKSLYATHVEVFLRTLKTYLMKLRCTCSSSRLLLFAGSFSACSSRTTAQAQQWMSTSQQGKPHICPNIKLM